MLIIVFDVKEVVPKGLVLAGQISNFAYYCDVVRRLRESVLRLRSELWQQKNWLWHHDNTPSHTTFFTMDFLTENNTTVIPTYFSLFPD
jgi:hypothetical protein